MYFIVPSRIHDTKKSVKGGLNYADTVGNYNFCCIIMLFWLIKVPQPSPVL